MNFEKPKTKTEQAMELAENFGIYFVDQFNKPFLLAGNRDHDEIISLNSREFKSFLANKYYSVTGSPANSSIISSILLTLTGQTQQNGQTYKLENRVSWHDGKIFYDFSNPKWDVIEISKNGWEITKSPLPLFKRYGHQKPQVFPSKKPVDLNALIGLFRVGSDDKLLLHVWIISCVIPNIPHPVLILHGPQGSTKSTFFKFVRRLIDPSAMELISFPKDKAELIQNLAHHYFTPFDNIAYLSQDQSDVLCKACTGEGSSKRQLFTDDDDIIYSYKRVLGLNGINNAATKPDLLDRSILVSFKRVSKNERRTDHEINLWFEKLLPGFLTHVFDTLVKALEIKENLRLKEKPRMADFAEWGEAISLALGNNKNEFLQVYFRNINLQVYEALEGSPVGEAIMALMENRDEWIGTPSELLTELESVAEQKKIRTFTKAWPKAAHALTRRLNELKTTLADLGVFVDERKGVRRVITIAKKSVDTVLASETPNNGRKQLKLEDAKDAKDAFAKKANAHAPISTDLENVNNEKTHSKPQNIEEFKKTSGNIKVDDGNTTPSNSVFFDSVGVQCSVCYQRSHEGEYKNDVWHCADCLKGGDF